MGGIPLPALSIKPPDMPDYGQEMGKLVQMKGMLQQQEMQKQQLQGAQQENEQRQMDIDSSKALQKAYTEAQGNPDQTIKLAAQYGAKPQALLQLQTAFQDQKLKTLDLVSKQGAEAGRQANLMQGAHDSIAAAPTHDRPALYQQQLQGLQQQGVDVSHLPPQYPGDDQFKMLGAVVKGHTQQVEEALKQAEAQKNTAQAGEADATTANKQAEAAFYAGKGSLLGAPGVPTETAQINAAIKTGKIKNPAQWPGYRAAQEAATTQPYKIQTAMAEGQAKQLMEGMAKPGYAFDPATGQTVLTDQTAYLKSGGKLQAFRTVGEKDVREDTMLTNRLGDVHQKLGEYQMALQKPVSESDKGNMAALLGTHGFKVGAFGSEIPMDRLNNALQAENLSKLSPAARDQLVAYRNMREALLGYKTVLSGSSRGSDKQMELLDQAIPIPSLTDQDYSQRAIKSFRGNLQVVGQGLPTLPGIKSPQQIEDAATGKGSSGGGSDPLGLR